MRASLFEKDKSFTFRCSSPTYSKGISRHPSESACHVGPAEVIKVFAFSKDIIFESRSAGGRIICQIPSVIGGDRRQPKGRWSVLINTHSSKGDGVRGACVTLAGGQRQIWRRDTSPTNANNPRSSPQIRAHTRSLMETNTRNVQR